MGMKAENQINNIFIKKIDVDLKIIIHWIFITQILFQDSKCYFLISCVVKV